jgi:hypothetical protein
MINDDPNIETGNSNFANGNIAVMAEIKGLTEQDNLDLVFQKEYDKLSGGAKNILYDLNILSFSNARDYYIIHQGKIDFMPVRNVGIKKNAELLIFFDELKEYFSSQNELNKEETDNTINLPESSGESNQNQLTPVLNNKMELVFRSKLKDISFYAKGILKSKNAKTLQGFYHYFFIDHPGNFNVNIQDGRAASVMQIIKFKKIVNEIIDQYKSDSIQSGLFSDLKFYFQDSVFVKNYRREVFIRCMNIQAGKKFEMHKEAAKDLNLTIKKVNQVADEFSIKIQMVLNQFTQNGYTDINQYFKDDYFIIDDVYAETINKREGTNFSKHVICYALRHTLPDDYGFYSCHQKLPECSGIFYRKDLALNIPACLNLIRKIYLKPQKIKFNKIELEKIIEQSGFKMESQVLDSSFFQAKIQLVEIIGLYNNSLPDRIRKVNFDNNFLIIRTKSENQNTNRILEVLRASKKPLHFKEIYQRLIENNVSVKSVASIHNTLVNSEYFVLKGDGYYGLREWGGYFGKIGDVTEQILRERKNPIPFLELKEILCRELIISKDSIITVLFHYKYEDRFVRFQNSTVGLKSWFNEEFIKIHRYKR